jgi:transposase InsO family protein
VRNHAQAIVACDFCVAVTATFRLLYVFVVMEYASRRILHVHVTAHHTAPWTLQQLREAIPADHVYRFLIHDRDSIFSQGLDQRIRQLGLRVLRTPPHSPQANALCERMQGARICPWGQAFHNRPRPYQFLCKNSGIGCRRISGW